MQTFVDLDVNVALDALECPAASFVKGVSSGATGFVETTVSSSTAVKLLQTSGTFITGEQIIINGDESISRSIRSIQSHSIRDVKSIYQSVDNNNNELEKDFMDHVVLQKKQ